jgi:hypothetical protein
VAGQRQLRVELGYAREGAEIVGQGIRRGPWPEADVRCDAPEQSIARDEHAVAQECKVAVSVAGQVEHLPAADLVSWLERIGVRRVVHERRQLLLLGADGGRLLRRRPVLDQVLLGALGGLGRPRPAAVLVVEHPLGHPRLRQLGDDRGAAHVVGMEVRDDDSLRPPDPGKNAFPALARPG